MVSPWSSRVIILSLDFVFSSVPRIHRFMIEDLSHRAYESEACRRYVHTYRESLLVLQQRPVGFQKASISTVSVKDTFVPLIALFAAVL